MQIDKASSRSPCLEIMWKDYRKDLWLTLAGGSALFLMEPWWDLGSSPWAIAFFVFAGLRVWEDRARVAEWWPNRMAAKGARTARHDPANELSAFDVACRCARFRPRESLKNDPAVRAWMDQLTSTRTFFLNRIDAASVLTLGEWLPVVHGICARRNQRLPKFFRRAMESLDLTESRRRGYASF